MVLVHYRSRIIFSLGEWAPQIQTRFHVSDPTQDITDIDQIILIYGALTLFGQTSQLVLLTILMNIRFISLP